MPVIIVSKMGKCIQKLREERGWSLEELAGRILLSPEELKCMENGIKEPDKKIRLSRQIEKQSLEMEERLRQAKAQEQEMSGKQRRETERNR